MSKTELMSLFFRKDEQDEYVVSDEFTTNFIYTSEEDCADAFSTHELLYVAGTPTSYVYLTAIAVTDERLTEVV